MTWLAQRILETLAADAGSLAVADLAARLGRDAKNVGMACLALHRRELIARAGHGVYRLAPGGRALLASGGVVRSGPAHGRRAKVQPRTLRHRLWTALAHRPMATLGDLLMRTAEGDERNAEHNARRYLRLLERTGYLTRMPGRPIAWRVVRWTGPRAPAARAGFTAVFDPNLNRTLPEEARP